MGSEDSGPHHPAGLQRPGEVTLALGGPMCVSQPGISQPGHRSPRGCPGLTAGAESGKLCFPEAATHVAGAGEPRTTGLLQGLWVRPGAGFYTRETRSASQWTTGGQQRLQTKQ